ncbi:MAG: glucose-1-phosphate cytidylyltransferase [Acidobacteria bacterium]|jgi:glucose-1-phosphate cytidylyltransferase|nr:glucose-1-phosphate cytidylyltransferase [Acidobacteriota bacterium]
MKVVILAGGLGTRLAEETEVRPKPMVEIGGHPILWHIMKIYAAQGFNEFFIALGYKSEIIKRYFLDYYTLSGNMSVNLSNGKVEISENEQLDDWTVNLIDTGQRSMTGGRIKRLEPFLKDGTFMVTYGDGVANVNLQELVKFHHLHGKMATVMAVHPPARYGELLINEDSTTNFSEKPQTHEGWINGGFMILEPKVLDYLSGDESILELEGLERLANEGQLIAYKHYGFWQCMDTLRDKRQLEAAWESGNPPWKVW